MAARLLERQKIPASCLAGNLKLGRETHNAPVLRERFTEAVGLDRHALYCQDYGGPVGFRLAVCHPERVTALLIQNANAYKEGVTQLFEDVVLRLWTEQTPQTEQSSARSSNCR